MRKFLGVAVVVAILMLSGCRPRDDYMKPNSKHAVINQANNIVSVLSPLGTLARVLVSEIARDLDDKYADKNNAPAAENAAPGTVKVWAKDAVLKQDANGVDYLLLPAE